MQSQLEYSVPITPDAVLNTSRANTPDAAEVLASLERQSMFCKDAPMIVSQIDGHNLRLHFQGGRLQGRLSEEHVEVVEATRNGSRITVELKNFDPIWRLPACIGLGCVTVGIVFGLMLLKAEVWLAVFIVSVMTLGGVLPIIWARRVASRQKQRFVDFLSEVLDQ